MKKNSAIIDQTADRGDTRAALDQILAHVRDEPSRTWSIIITLYGDAIVPRGGSVWLGTLLKFFQAIGIADGVVRTATSRLAGDGWLERHKVGRNSFYRLATKGVETFQKATTHIYKASPPLWQGAFEMVIEKRSLNFADAKEMRPLEEAGFGSPSIGVWIAPLGVQVPNVPRVVRIRADGDMQSLRELAARSWELDQTADAYREFLSAFEPLRAALAGGAVPSDLDAMVARVLLIHEYRRIVLRDPLLPVEVLPEDWPGTTARALCAEVYGHVLAGSERWLDENAIDERGAVLPLATEIFRRFKR